LNHPKPHTRRQAGRLEFEINVRETVRDVVYLHNHTMVAAAQRK
jgi:hypothetical protein